MDPKRSQGSRHPRVFTEAEYRANASKVVAHAAEAGSAIVARADGSPRFMIAIRRRSRAMNLLTDRMDRHHDGTNCCLRAWRNAVP
jgi:hypothetical protein